MAEIADNLTLTDFEIFDHGACEGQYNMDFDTERARLLMEGKGKPMFRLYAWNPWTLSLGANQSEEQIDPERIRSLGYGLVRRPTGGRAVFHADELTYSVVMKLPEGKTVHDVYREVHVLLLNAFNRLGAGLEFEKSQPDFRDFYKTSAMSAACFASSARYEISYMGRKIVGSAQRLTGDTLLQHGSILLGPGHEQISELIRTDSQEKRDILKKYVLEHAATLSEAAGRRINYAEAAKAVKEEIESLKS